MTGLTKTPLCGQCVDGFRVDPETLLPVERCECRMQPVDGERAKADGQAATVAANDAAFRAALKVILDAAKSLPVLSSNDVRHQMRLAQVPGPVVGAAFGQACKDKVIRPTGYVPSTDPGTKHHPVREYESLIYRRGVA